MTSLAPPELPFKASAFTDFQQIRAQPGNSPAQKKAALENAATQFESMFMDMWLKSMRDAGSVFRDGNYLSSAAVDVHEEMLDHQWAVHLSESGGIGLKDVLLRQLGGQTDVGADVSTALPERQPAQTQVPQSQVRPQGQRAALFEDAESFVSQLMPMARQVLGHSSINPLVAIAQSALETGWGSQVIHDDGGRPSFNLFGIKAAGWDGDAVEITTMEHELGGLQPRPASFRSYQSWQDSLEDYLNFLESDPRYQGALESGADPAGFLNALQRAGYATDPDYAIKIEKILETVAAITGGD